MPKYALTSSATGRTYNVATEEPWDDSDMAEAVAHFDSQAEEAERNKPFLDVTDLASGIGSAIGGLTKTGPAAARRMQVGLSRPDTYPEEAKQAFAAEKEYTDQLARENTYRLLTGDLGSAGEAMREAGGSLGFTAGSMGAAIPATLAGGAAGTAIGGPVGGTIGGVSAGMAASAAAAYRMAGSQFLDDAYNTYLQNNPNISEAEKEAAYQELLPLAQESALWEAGPEAIGNAVTMGAGKVILGLGKNTIKKLAASALGKMGVGVGAQATELATETVTQLGQDLPQAKAEAFNRGEDMAQAKGRYAPGMEGAVQAFKDVGPQTLALGGLMLGAGGAYKGGRMALGLDKKAEPAPEAPTVEGTLVEEAPEEVDPLVAQLEAAKAAEVPVDDLIQSAQERFGILQAKAADQTTPLTQEEADEMDALTAAFADPANIDPTALADLYDVRIAQPVVEEVAPVDRVTEIQNRLAEIEAENGPRDETTLLLREEEELLKELDALNQAPAPVAPVDQQQAAMVVYELTSPNAGRALDLDEIEMAVDNIERTLQKGNEVDWAREGTLLPNIGTAEVSALKGLVATQEGRDAIRAAIEAKRSQANAPNPIAQNAINAVNNPAANLPATAALLNADQGALNPTQENAPTQERQVKSPSGTPPVQGQPPEQGANFQIAEGAAPWENQGAEVAPAPAPAPAKTSAQPLNKGDGGITRVRRMPDGTAQREGQGAEVAPAGQGPQFSQGGQTNTSQDAEYLELAKNPEKNRSLLQKMVDVAAKAAGYDGGIVWHGDRNEEFIDNYAPFTEPKIPFFTAVSKKAASWYGTPRAYYSQKSKIAGAEELLQAADSLGIYKDKSDPYYEFWPEISKYSEYEGVNDNDLVYVPAVREELLKRGYTSVKVSDQLENQEITAVIYIGSPNQVKSADLVTYDAKGNVIPLSQRFNAASPDIRFSQGGQAGPQNQSPESLRHAELEAKFNAGTITPEETAEAEKLVADRSEKGGWNIAAKHGTTHNFFTFTRANANIENNLGAGFYLSNTEDDVTENYAGVGPDLTNRIEKRAEQILNDREDQPAYGTPAYKKKMEAAKKKAAKELSGGKQRVISAKVRFTNPVILDGNGARPSGTIIELAPDIEQYRAEAIERVKENNPEATDENIDDYSDEVQDAMYELQSEDYNADGPMEKIRGVVDSFEGTDWNSLSEGLSGEESLPAYRLEQLLRENEGTAYATDSESGDSAVGELIRQVFEALGYDGIIDKNVNAKFGSQSKGKSMAGMHSGTIHYIAFDPNQIKSAETFTGVPLDQRFDPKSEDIRFSQAPQTPTGLPAAKVKTVVDQVMAKNKSPLQVRVITRNDLETSPEFQYVRDSLANQGADSQFTEAWVDGRTQTVVIVADSFSSAARIREVLVHEIIGHAGVDAFASEADISRVLKILDRRVPDLVKQVRSRYPNLDEAGIAREVIAKFSEQYQSADFASLPSGMKALWRELKAWLGGIIQRFNVNIAAFDDLTLNWFYTNAINAAAGITPLPAPTATTAATETAPTATTAATETAPTATTAATETAPAPVATENAPAPVATENAPAPETAAPASKKKFVLPRARIRQKAAPAEAENAIGVANAVVDAARAKIGLAPVYAPARQSFGALWDQALRALVMNPKRGEELVEDLNKKPKEISPLETAILTHELVTRTLNFDRATEALNNATESEKEKAREDYDRAITKLQEAWNASDVSGTEQGRSLNARKMLVALNYTLAKMVSMRTAAAERPLNPEQRAQTEELFAKIDALQKKLAELEKSGKPSGEEARLEDLLARAREEGKLEAQKEAKLLEEAAAILKAEEAALAAKIKKGADAAKVLEDSVEAARARLRARKGLFGAKTPEVAQEEAGDIKFSIADTGIVGLSAQDIADLTLVGKSYVAEGATTLESWSEKMVAEFGEDITEYLEPLYENSKAPVAAAPAAKAPKEKAAPAEKAPKEKKIKASPMARIKADAKEGKELSPKLVYELVKQKLQEGISGVEDVFKAVTKDLQEEFPLMTEREIRDIFSGYGKAKFPSQEELAKKVRELRRLSQLTSALEDAKAFIIPLKSGQQREAVTKAIRDLQKEITRVMQENNLAQATTSKQLKSTLDSLKTRLKNQIVDLNAQIKKKEKAPKKAGVVYDQEANELRAERDRLQEILNGIVGPSQPSPTQRIRQRVNQLQKEITDLEKKVATRDITKRATQPVPETERIQVLKDQRDALREQLHVIRVEIEGDPSLTQEQINERAEKAIQRNIKDLERRITEKDFSKKAGNQASGPIVEQLRAQREALREQYNILREAIQGKREKTYQQRIDMADKALDKSIAELNRQIDTGDIAVRPKGAPIETPNLKAKRDQRDALKKVRDDMRMAVKKALADPVAKQLAKDKKNIARQIEKLRTKIANRDFSKPAKIVHTTDLEKQNLEAKLNLLKSDWARILFEEKLANRTTTQKLLGGVGQTLNTARAVLTSFDFSGVLRQGGFIVLGNPLRAIKNLRPMFAAFASKEAETKAKLALQRRDNYALYQRDKLFLADMDATSSMAKQEEAYASRWVDKIPKLLGGGLIRGSQRGYVTFLNNLRADSYDAMVLAFRKGPEVTQEESKAIVNYINIATGRGDLGKFSQAAEGLNTVFFAPRLVASRFQLLLGMPYFSATGRTKNLILQEYAKFLTGVAVVYMLGMLAQEDEDKPIETDPRSTNFGKIRFGNSRIDPLSGLQQVTVLLARLVSGQTKTSTGKIVDIRGENVPYGGATPVNIVAKFARSKFSPVFGSVTNMVQGENVIGEKVTPFGELERMVVPMSFSEVGKIMEEQGVPKGMVLSTLALFGMGVQTYDETKKR